LTYVTGLTDVAFDVIETEAGVVVIGCIVTGLAYAYWVLGVVALSPSGVTD
jgi:hypothetical protein